MRWWCDAEPASAPTGMTFQQAAGKASPKALPRPDGLGPNPNPPPTPIECGMAFPNGWVVYNRYHQCTVQQVTLTVTRVPPGTVIGVGQVQVIHHITSHPRDRQWTDDVYLILYQASPSAAWLTIGAGATTDHRCTGWSTLPAGGRPRHRRCRLRSRPWRSMRRVPFASTREGASFVARDRVSVASVLALHNTTAGSRIGAFYRDQRVIDNEAFWVDTLP